MIKQIYRLFRDILVGNKKRIDGLEAFVLSQQQHLQNLQKEKDGQEQFIQEKLEKVISREIFYQLLSLQHRIDQLIFDIKLKDKSSKNKEKKVASVDLLDSFYLEFEEAFRGKREDILKRYEKYLEFIDIKNVKKALDIGAGRGEWVELLQKNGVDAVGIDLNASMIKNGKKHVSKGLVVSDAFEYLQKTPGNSFDMVSAFHIVEHISFRELLTLIGEIKRVLKANGTILIETPNPKNMLVSTLTFYKDPTHRNPVVDETLKFMLEFLGFKDLKVTELHPFDEHIKLKEESQSARLLNSLLFGAQDYLIQGKI